MNQLKAETQRLNKLRDGIQRKLRDTENHKLEVEQQRETLRNQVLAIERGSRMSFGFFAVVVVLVAVIYPSGSTCMGTWEGRFPKQTRNSNRHE